MEKCMRTLIGAKEAILLDSRKDRSLKVYEQVVA